MPIVAPEFARQIPAIHNLSAAHRQGMLAGTLYGLLGAVCAGASLRLARRDDRDLPFASASAGLSAGAAGHLTNTDADKVTIEDARSALTLV